MSPAYHSHLTWSVLLTIGFLCVSSWEMISFLIFQVWILERMQLIPLSVFGNHVWGEWADTLPVTAASIWLERK